MPRFASRHRVLAISAVVGLATNLTACYSWRIESPTAPLAPRQREDVRLTLTNGQRLVLYKATVTGDSIRGSLYDMRTYRMVVPAQHILRFETRHLSPAKTAAYAAGMTAVTTALVGALVYLMAEVVYLATWDGPLSNCCQ